MTKRVDLGQLPTRLGLKSPFGVRSRVDYGDWVVSGADILEAPSSAAPSNLALVGTTVYGPQGYYTITNVTNASTAEYFLTPPFTLRDYGQAGDEFEVYHTTYSTPSPAIEVPSGAQVLTETWSGYTTGDGWTELDPAYDRQNSELAPTISNDADAPDGKRATLTMSTIQSRWLRRADTVFADGTWSRFQIRARIEIPLTTDIIAVGFGSTSAFTGMIASSTGASAGRIAYINRFDVTGTNLLTSSGTQMASGLTQNDTYEFRIDVASDLRTVQVKQWATSGSEPGSWGASFSLAADASLSDGFRIVSKVSSLSDTTRLLAWRLALDTDALAF